MVADYIKQLNKMYNDKYYIRQQRKCKFFNQCSSKINEPLKFCSDRTSKLPHSREMEKNCINIFFDEIDTLKPDLVVIQVVSNCPKEFWSKMKEKYHYEGTEDKPIKCAKRNGVDNTNTSLYKLMYDDLTPFYCLWTYHGNGAPYGNKESRFVNNQKYITEELNPVLDSTITELKSIL